MPCQFLRWDSGQTSSPLLPPQPVALVWVLSSTQPYDLGLVPFPTLGSPRCLAFAPTSKSLFPSVLVTCGLRFCSPGGTPRPTSSTSHPTEGAQAGEGFPAGRHLAWLLPAQPGLGNDRGQGEDICTFQVSACHAQQSHSQGPAPGPISEMALARLWSSEPSVRWKHLPLVPQPRSRLRTLRLPLRRGALEGPCRRLTELQIVPQLASD